MARIRMPHVLCTSALIGLLFQPTARAQEEKLGEVNFPSSCSASAQTQFNRAVAMLHSFFVPETVKAFTAITRQEPSCAMAYWGVAISQRPNPLVAPFPAELMRNGWEAIEAGRAAGAKTQRERDWIEALAVFFKDYDKIDLRTRTLAYEAAMARLTTNYPDDSEAAIFYALALNEAVDLSDKTYAKQFKAASILQSIEAKLPNHPDTALHHPQLRLCSHLPAGSAGRAALRGTRADRAACASYALAHVLDAGNVGGFHRGKHKDDRGEPGLRCEEQP